LRPFGLVLHHDGRWSHEGQPIRNERLRALFDRSVRYLPEADVYVVQVGRYRGQIEVQEAAFFVRSFDPESGGLQLSDESREALEVGTLRTSAIDGALLCRVKRELAPEGVMARFAHSAQADLLLAAEESPGGPCLRFAGELRPLPPL